jgi:Cu2+-exporting ATPase
LRRMGMEVESAEVRRLAEQGKTVVFVLVDGALVGAIALADIVRPESRTAIEGLKAMRIRCLMLTGDAEAVTRSVAQELDLDDYFAEVLPPRRRRRCARSRRTG